MKATLYFLGQERPLLNIKVQYYTHFEQWNGRPSSIPMGGLLFMQLESAAIDALLEERINTVDYELYLRGYPMDKGEVIFYDENGDVLKRWKFNDAILKMVKTTFEAIGEAPMITSLEISAAIQNFGHLYLKPWNISHVEEKPYESPVVASEKKEKNPFRINIEAKNSDIRAGIFGFDTIPDKDFVTSDYEKLKQVYKPLSEKILNEQYIPSWLSLRKNQTVELALDWDKKRNAKEYNNISFQAHPDFTFEPENLKEAKKVKITCKNNNQNPLQLLIKADDALTVGALNVFYPIPKEIDLEWRFVEIKGNRVDENDLNREIKKSDLESYLKKGFNPGLIDINITNEQAILVDITEDAQKLKERGFLKNHRDTRVGNYIERSSKNNVLQFISKKITQDPSKIIIYFINQKCINEVDIQENGIFKAAGGVSPTGTGIAYLVLDPEGNIKDDNIIHETMHALGLRHTFESIHKFKNTKTVNYMDYHNNKKHTYKWQWENLHKYSKLK